jgi:hypothetical protein
VSLVGTHFVCARFRDLAQSRAAYERLTAVSHGVSVNRVALTPDGGDQYVIVLGEAKHSEQVEDARKLLAPGVVCNPPELLLEISRMRRLRLKVAGDGGRMARTPLGQLTDAFGRKLGSLRRPQ